MKIVFSAGSGSTTSSNGAMYKIKLQCDFEDIIVVHLYKVNHLRLKYKVFKTRYNSVSQISNVDVSVAQLVSAFGC